VCDAKIRLPFLSNDAMPSVDLAHVACISDGSRFAASIAVRSMMTRGTRSGRQIYDVCMATPCGHGELNFNQP
jgi:hypothetical protein